jgi:AcrR family transcriptional regulator
VPRRSIAEAAITRATVARRAAELGSREGLEPLSIGRLAAELRLSKSGVIGHFGSKQELQLAAVEAAVARFIAEVWQPAAAQPAGLVRLRALMASWLSYLERDVFPGGCFLTAAAHEFDDRPGPVRDIIATAWKNWLGLIEREVATAQAAGGLAHQLSPRQITFQLHAYVTEGNWAKQLFGDPAALESSRAAIERLLSTLKRSI